ncbi:MAG: hypothetical protein JO265_13765, partial [Acidimicrobiia bacterium]|nr:hypothetical protein [Acidimicrobiia bacterium]
LAVDLPLLTADHVAGLLTGLSDQAVDAVAGADHRGRPNPLLAAYRGDVLRRTASALGPGDAAARLLPSSCSVVDLGEAGRLNVNRPEELALVRRLLRADP